MHDIFSLFRSSEENERSAQKEKKRRDRASGPHIVFDPIPFILTRVMQRSSKKRRDESVGCVSPVLFSAWFHDLLSALVHCHTNHVILRSVLTDQILIDHSGVIKLAGFYRATVLPMDERDTFVIPHRNVKARSSKDKKFDDGDESNPYSAPELLLGSLKHTKESDIWAIGEYDVPPVAWKTHCLSARRDLRCCWQCSRSLALLPRTTILTLPSFQVRSSHRKSTSRVSKGPFNV